ncbi:MAG: SUMF1/EgtB/PvdO family nonheme iron enzyme [Planctomycetota bacterium]
MDIHRIAILTLACSAAVGASDAARAQSCAGDVDGSGGVNAVDLGILLSQWGASGAGGASADLNGDGAVDAIDLATLLAGWGPCVEVPPWATLVEALPDPSVVTEPELRAAIAATGRAWRVRDTATQIEMLLVPPGAFQMGCVPSLAFACSDDEYPVHDVVLTKPFYIGRHEVTQAQWTAVVGANPSYFQGAAYPNAANRPVEKVSWHELAHFLKPTGMRLPTEAEWEFACRGGTTAAFHGCVAFPDGAEDDALLGEIAWYAANNGASGTPTFGTKPVGQKAGNGFGLHDMAGNVREWVADWYGGSWYAWSPVSDPIGPATGSDRVVRGGAWIDGSNTCRTSNRHYFPPVTTGSVFVGFRVARDP